MKATILLVGAAALALTPAIASAQTAPGNGQNNGNGYWHLNSGNANGQPGKECGEDGPTPGNASSAPGSAFNPDGNAGTRYAGEQPQNSRNTASVSQYDTACANQAR